MAFGQLRRGFAAVALAVVAVVGAPVSTAHAAKSCLRGGAELVAADGKVRVVRQARWPRNAGTDARWVGLLRRHAFMACWVPTGRRITMHVEEDYGASGMYTHVRIVDGRY